MIFERVRKKLVLYARMQSGWKLPIQTSPFELFPSERDTSRDTLSVSNSRTWSVQLCCPHSIAQSPNSTDITILMVPSGKQKIGRGQAKQSA